MGFVRSPHAVSHYAEDRGSVNLDPCYKLYPADETHEVLRMTATLAVIVALYHLTRQLSLYYDLILLSIPMHNLPIHTVIQGVA